MSKDKEEPESKTIAQNRKARHLYFIEDTLEAGLMLQGTEVKSLRAGKASINEAHAGEMKGELYLFNATIEEYTAGNRFNHEPKRPRKLLLKKRELNKLLGQVRIKGMTLVPLSLYFNKRGIAKVLIGVASGKKQHEKRDTIKEREWKREQSRALKNKR